MMRHGQLKEAECERPGLSRWLSIDNINTEKAGVGRRLIGVSQIGIYVY